MTLWTVRGLMGTTVLSTRGTRLRRSLVTEEGKKVEERKWQAVSDYWENNRSSRLRKRASGEEKEPDLESYDDEWWDHYDVD